jgi:hypothetical protein
MVGCRLVCWEVHRVIWLNGSVQQWWAMFVVEVHGVSPNFFAHGGGQGGCSSRGEARVGQGGCVLVGLLANCIQVGVLAE